METLSDPRRDSSAFAVLVGGEQVIARGESVGLAPFLERLGRERVPVALVLGDPGGVSSGFASASSALSTTSTLSTASTFAVSRREVGQVLPVLALSVVSSRLKVEG